MIRFGIWIWMSLFRNDIVFAGKERKPLVICSVTSTNYIIQSRRPGISQVILRMRLMIYRHFIGIL